ncbi:MAG: hypothetical protein LBD16_06260 [Oscillospiraceae bacterium]|jgi:hypothetical protein|nr:hypothetical protein [Oscillospiraceae bacterium]
MTNYLDELGGARINVYLGGYGCGKTELALDAALRIAAPGRKVALIDVDIVNPYFRSSDKRVWLESQGVRVIAPVYAMTSVDTPVLSPAIKSVFDGRDERAVFDVGGDTAGSAVIGGYAERIRESESRVWYVINTSRPLSETAEDNVARINEICLRSRLRPDGLIHNTNLQHETAPEVLIDSFRIIEQISERTGIPVAAVTGEARLAARLPNGMRGLFVGIGRRTVYSFI